MRIGELFADRSVLLISHRFSTVRSADRIYVLNERRVVESGTREELVAAGGCRARRGGDATGHRALCPEHTSRCSRRSLWPRLLTAETVLPQATASLAPATMTTPGNTMNT